MGDTKKGTARFVIPGFVLLFGSVLLVMGAQQEVAPEIGPEEDFAPAVPSADCIFLSDPLEFTFDEELAFFKRSDITDQVSMFTGGKDGSAASTVDPNSIPRRTIIDNAIFSRMATAGIQSAPLATDEEFIRRIYLDLTGRIPSAAAVEAFLPNADTAKRDAVIDSLMGTPEFIDKWTMFFGDLFKVNGNATNVNRFPQGRDAFYLYLRDSVATNKPYDQMAREIIGATGDSFVNGAANWPVGNTVAMGPAQDTYDGGAVNLASQFMGVSVVDCLLCHDGARHLDEVNLWGSRQTRQNMWGLSAYFVRTRMQREVVSTTPAIQKFMVSDLAAGAYNLNTTTGNRSSRQPVNGLRTIAPSNPFLQTSGSAAPGSGVLQGESYRQALARQITGDFQFSRAIVNYVWEKFMVEAFVSPSNGFDLARLDPNNPPPAPWTLQPTNPELLDELARWFQQNRFDLQGLIRLIAKSNAYQLSSTYPGTWDISYVPYYARKYVRRLEAEEIHDSIAMATNIPGNYVFQTELPPVQWAMQLPDTREPLRTQQVATFLNSFGRGDRDLNVRRSDGSILQALNMMNNAFVMTRIHQNNPGSRVADLLSRTTNPATIIQELFVHTLSRLARPEEIALYTPMFQQSPRAGAEGLQWLLLNKLQFIFNY